MSFNYIRAYFGPQEFTEIGYTNDVPLHRTIEELRRKAVMEDEPISIIGHSLGGVIAAAIAQVADVEKIVTYAAPFGGSETAAFWKWITPSQLFSDISPTSSTMMSLRCSPPTTPMLSFVTDPNYRIMGERGDGVVSVKSQKAMIGPTYETVELNHFEVLLSPSVATQTRKFLFG